MTIKQSPFFLHSEMIECFRQLSVDPDCRAIVLTGAGKIFTAGKNMLSGSIILLVIFSHVAYIGLDDNTAAMLGLI